MKEYLDLLSYIKKNGVEKTDRTGTGTISVFGYQHRHKLSDGFPLLTTKKVHIKSVVHELLWFLTGSTNIRPLLENKVTIWSDWPYRKYITATGSAISMKDFEKRIISEEDFAQEWGNLGRAYGAQWRKWRGHDGKEYDQIAEVIRLLKTTPDSRRILFSAWNAAEIQDVALPPCHMMAQFGVSNGKLHCHMYQRSADAFLGVPFNIASYALLTHMLAQVTGLEPGDMIHSYGDLHIYKNHMDQVAEQLSRQPDVLPTLKLNPAIMDIDAFTASDIEVTNYTPQSAIKAPVAV